MDCPSKNIDKIRKELYSVLEKIYNTDVLYRTLPDETRQQIDRVKLLRIHELTSELYSVLK